MAVNPVVVGALRDASKNLALQSVRHLVVGALAVGVHGWPRATADVDLLLDGSQTPRVELPESFGGVAVDYVPVDVAGDFLLDAFDHPLLCEDVPIARVEVVIITKLIRLAMRDQADVVELVKSGLVDVPCVRAYVDAHAPMLTSRFDALSEQAKREGSPWSTTSSCGVRVMPRHSRSKLSSLTT